MSSEDARRETLFGTIPNILTVARMASTIPLCALVLNDQMTAACGLFVVSGALDWADGAIARAVPGQSSVLGSFLDPVADKLLIAGATLSLAATGHIAPLVTGVIVSRDVGLVVAGFLYRGLTKPADAPFFSTTRGDSFQVTPSRLSKANMAAQVGLVSLALANGAGLMGAAGGGIVTGVSAVVVATTLGSWYGYARTPTFARLLSLLRKRAGV